MATSLIRNSAPLTPYRRAMLRALWWSSRGGAVSYERGTPVAVQSAAARGPLVVAVPLSFDVVCRKPERCRAKKNNLQGCKLFCLKARPRCWS